MNNEVTTFVISSGNNPNFEYCIEALKKQTAKTKIEIIKNYAPMSLAFQEMLIRCQTPYYVECDEDMILKENAIEVLYNTIKHSDQKIAMVSYNLHDVHYDYNIVGIKIYKTEIFKKYPYNLNIISCEMEQLERMKKDGYKIIIKDDVVGLHSPYWTNELIFERYYDLNEKYKLYGYSWLENLLYNLQKKLYSHPTPNNFYAVMGAISSMSSKEARNREKNFVIKNKEYLKIHGLVSTPDRATLFMTNKCNFKCSFCLRNIMKLESFLDMDIGTVKTLLEKFPTIGGVTICGYGEPLMCDNLEEILQYLILQKKTIGVITNGSLLKEKMAILQKHRPNYISVSLNAYNQETHTKQVGVSGYFERVLDGIRASTDSDISTYLSYVCSKESILDLPDFIELANSLKVTGVHLHNLLPHNLVERDEEEETFLKSVLTVDDKKAIDDIKQLPGAEIIKAYPILIDTDHPMRMCRFPFITISVNGSGSVSVCNSVFSPCKANGNINDINVWQNSYCQKMRMMFGEEKLPKACELCFRNYENGGTE